MSKYEANNIFPRLNKLEMKCLYKAIQNECLRWEDTINFNNSSSGDLEVAADYEYDSIRLEQLVKLLDQHTESHQNPEEVSFSSKYTMLLIEAVDHEFDLWKEGKSSLNAEEFDVIDQVRKKIRELAASEYGFKILEQAHHKKRETQNE